MIIVGLTGGVGAGKSIVAKLFSELGVPIIDADIIARELTKPNMPPYTDIVKHFGSSILLPDETIDRSRLRHIIFTDTKQRLWLENLLHPLIRKEMEDQIKNISSPYCILVIPLLFEVEFYSVINRTLVIDAPYELQISRVMARDRVPQSHVETIINTQADRQSRLARAHDVITNDGDINALLPQVKMLHEKYTQLGTEK
jgi:dephospho-CoA kinase